MLNMIQDFVSMHQSAFVAVGAVVAIGAGIFGYGRYHEQRTRGRGPGLSG